MRRSSEQQRSLKWISVKRSKGKNEIIVNKEVKDEVSSRSSYHYYLFVLYYKVFVFVCVVL